MQINQPTYTPNFQARFIYSESLNNIAKFAVENHVFGKLKRMQANISRAHLKTRLQVDIGKNNENIPTVTFTRLYPRFNVRYPQKFDDYTIVKRTTYEAEHQNINPLWFAMQKIIEMGKFAPNNEIFQEVVIKK